MTWDEYKESFTRTAYENGKNIIYIDACLDYAEKLFNKDFPIIFDHNHLAQLVGYKIDYFVRMMHAPLHFYRSFYIQKKSGALREINEPLPDLKSVQKWIYNEILKKVQISVYAKGFVKGQSIKSNARFHRKQPTVLTIDIKDFFPSISFYKIYNIFHNIGYSKKISAVLANLCCYNDSLPQGAPTSPMLSNIVFTEIDNKIGCFAMENGLRYTRYADDITFSGSVNISKVLYYVKSTLRGYGFILNEKKTRIANRGTRQEVTGIVTNEKLQATKYYRKKIRQEMYYIQKYGLDSHLYHIGEARKNYLQHLLGKISFAYSINKSDYEMRNYLDIIKRLIQEDNAEQQKTTGTKITGAVSSVTISI